MKTKQSFKIGNHTIGEGAPCFIIAEVSCNHEGDYDEAVRIIEAAADCGVDSVKLQTYTPDTITRNFKNKIDTGSIWDGGEVYKIYQQAHTPWDWHAKLAALAQEKGMELFSSPFDETAVDHLEQNNVPAYKIASFELVDTKLIEYVAKKKKPVLMSTGMANYSEIKEAYDILINNGVTELAIFHCNSGYPAPFNECNLKTMTALQEMFQVPIGLSDHTMYANAKEFKEPMGHVACFEAVKMGAKILELHLTMDREHARKLMGDKKGGYDWAFSKEPAELKKLVSMIRAYERGEKVEYETQAEKDAAALCYGEVTLEPTEREKTSIPFRPTLWVVENVAKGDELQFAGGKKGNVDSIRPGGGLHIRYADLVHGATAARDIKAGEPLQWSMIELHRGAKK